MFVTAEHTYGVRSKGVINYKLPKNLLFDASYIYYDAHQTAVNTINKEELRLSLSKPIRSRQITAFSRLSFSRFGNVKAKYSNVEFLFSSMIAGVSSNFTTSAFISQGALPFVSSNLALTFRLPKGIRVTPQTKFDYTPRQFNMFNMEVEKQLFHQGYVNFSYQADRLSKSSSFTLGLRYNFSFAQAAASVSRSRQTTITSQMLKGSLLYDGKTRFVGFSDQNSVGRSGLIISPFVDLNCNGVCDKGEPKALGLGVMVNGGRTRNNDKDSTIRVTGLEASQEYFITLDKNSFENIAWHIKNAIIKVTTEPNHFKIVQVPVSVVGEVSGTVMFKNSKGASGLGRMTVGIYDENNNLVTRMLSEQDGYFNYMGLAPGTYTARLDAVQLNTLKMVSSIDSHKFTITQKMDGDVVDGLEFVISKTGEEIK